MGKFTESEDGALAFVGAHSFVNITEFMLESKGVNMTHGGRSLALDCSLVSIKEDIWGENTLDMINMKGLLATAPCLLSTGAFLLWLKPVNVMGIERLLANAQTLLSTTELIMKMKPMSRMTLEGKAFNRDASLA